jgi:hypothetical protein
MPSFALRAGARPRRGFEVSLVGPSMRALGAGRRGCAHCRRTPLVGERIFFYGQAFVCELCRPLRREAPGRQEVVHSSERDHTVKRAPSRLRLDSGEFDAAS